VIAPCEIRHREACRSGGQSNNSRWLQLSWGWIDNGLATLRCTRISQANKKTRFVGRLKRCVSFSEGLGITVLLKPI